MIQHHRTTLKEQAGVEGGEEGVYRVHALAYCRLSCRLVVCVVGTVGDLRL